MCSFLRISCVIQKVSDTAPTFNLPDHEPSSVVVGLTWLLVLSCAHPVSVARIEVIEYEDERLRFKNHGTFLPLSVESVVENDFPESRYRNKFLVEAMHNVKMVETEGGGIDLQLFKI